MATLEIEMMGVGMTCVSTIIASVDMAWKLHRKKDEGSIVVIPKSTVGCSYEDDEKAISPNMLVKVKKMIPKIRRNGI